MKCQHLESNQLGIRLDEIHLTQSIGLLFLVD